MTDFTEEQLRKALIAADQAGDTEAATAIANRLKQRRLSPRKYGEKEVMQQRYEAAGGTDNLFPPSEASQMSGGERALAALDYGLENAAYGGAQLLANVIPGIDPSGINETVRDREEAYQQGGLGDYTGANIMRTGGEVAGLALPGGFAAKGVGALTSIPRWLMPTAQGVAAGASEGLFMPVAGEDYLGEKAAQIGTGAAIGGGTAAALQGGIKFAEGLVNAPRRAANLPGELVERRANDPLAQEGQRLVDETGVPLTGGQRSGSPSLKFVEQRARESILSSSRVAEGDLLRAQKFQQYVDGISGDVNSAEFANNLQGRVTNFVRDLAGQRSRAGREMYGAIDNFAGGEKIVQPRNLYDELTAIIEEAGTQEGGDIVKAAAQARKMLETIDKQGGYSAQEALGRLQNWSPYSKGTVFDDVSKGYDSVLKRRIYNAMMNDLDETAAQGGTIGDMVKAANEQWRKYSNQITTIEKSALGNMVGEEFASELMAFNKVAPEAVMDKFMRLRPSQAEYVTKFMAENMPDQLPLLRGSIIRDALDASMQTAATAGAEMSVNPGGYLRALGLTGGERGGEAMLRLQHIFGGEGSEAWHAMKNSIDVARRLADVSGKNFSGTSQANQFYQLMRAFSGHVTTALKTLGSTSMEALGLRRIADTMNPTNPLFGDFTPRPLIQAPRVIRGAPVPASVAAPGLAVGWGNQFQQ